MKARTMVEKRSDREIVITRTFNALPHIVFKAWTTAELFKRWWVPKSMGMTLVSCETDVRVGGGYKLVFGNGMAFHGRYTEVVPNERIVWTNDETEGGSITTLTLEEQDGKTLLTMRELYPSKEAMEQNGGAEEALPETFDQLDAILGELS